jgi:hypothetical protein
LIQRYSASGDGADLALVPVDEAAQSYVNDLPDNYNCLVFESGRDLFGRVKRSGYPRKSISVLRLCATRSINCIPDEGRPLGVGLHEQASNPP